LLLCFILLNINRLKAQNLIPNGDFEQNTCCVYYDSINNCGPWVNLCTDNWGNMYLYNWDLAHNAEYYNPCDNPPVYPFSYNTPLNYRGYQVPHSGVRYAAIINYIDPYTICYPGQENLRQILATKLNKQLVQGAYYKTSMYISLADRSMFSCANFQAYIADTVYEIVNSSNSWPAIENIGNYHGNATFYGDSSQDKLRWHKWQANYTANGTEKYTMIMNFIPDTLCNYKPSPDGTPVDPNFGCFETARYYIDDVSMELSMLGKGDTVFCNTNAFATTLSGSNGWQHYSWSNGGNTQSIQVTTPGFYVVTGTIDTLPNFTASDTVWVRVSDLAIPNILNLGNDTLVCPYTSVQLQLYNNKSYYNYNWSNTDTTYTTTDTDTGTYTLTVTDGLCVQSKSLRVGYYNTTAGFQLADTTIVMYPPYKYIAQTPYEGGVLYSINNAPYAPQIIITQSGTYTLQTQGCISYEDVFSVLFLDANIGFVPNIITPNNGDTINNYLRINNLPINSELTIYNRWGSMVYKTTNYKNDWDASNATAGVYYYILNIPGYDVRKGFVEVIK